MKINFENRKDITSPKNNKMETFTFKGKSVFENKNQIQKEAIEISRKLITDRLEKLDINKSIINDFDDERITYDIPLSLWAPALYSGNSDFILMNESKEVNFNTITHELLHAYSSQYRIKNIDEISKFSRDEKKSVKSGFHVNWYKDGFNNKASSINFSQLNEAVTEKLSRELVEENYNAIRAFQEKYNTYIKNKKNISLGKINRENKRIEKEIISEITEIQEKWENKIKTYNKETLEKINEINKKLSKKYTKKEVTDFIEGFKKMRAGYLHTMNNFQKMEISLEKSLKDTRNLNLKGIEKDYSFEIDRDSYQNYINILNYLIEGVALNNSKNISQVEDQKLKTWENLQRAYFKGDTIFLRIFDKTYGDLILRKFNNMGSMSKSYSDFMAEIENKNNELREKFTNRN